MASNLLVGSSFDVDKLTFEIFSILENKFLFGETKLSKLSPQNSRIRILSIDGGGATNGILAAKSLAHLESSLRRKSGNPNAYISDYFDIVAGSGAGGLLAALLFTRGKDGLPLFTADSALRFVNDHQKKLSSSRSVLRRFSRRGKHLEKLLRSTFGESTLRDTVKSVLIPCYDLSSRAPFVFSRADAVEADGFDFKISDVCLATCAVHGAVEMRSVDRKTNILGVDGGIAMNNPTAAAITHVLNNKQEFPLCNGVEDLLVLSLGGGESDFRIQNLHSSPSRFVRIAGEGASDTVDQAVSMAFGQCRTSNYVRIQANGIIAKKQGRVMEKQIKSQKKGEIVAAIEEMLEQKNVESVLFKGKRIVESTNLEKIESFGGELMKEEERRKTSILPTVVLKQASPSPRTSSATTLSTSSSY
ncbi:patatin-like protein 7 [Ricinus communis]|uniref:Patatin n=1 Tax=Ricinus communis TaxID=3988 RepID=B9SQ95_RICCO|nr:patatin-like protein 7 [Ricinus communis]EEF34215.1 Patatin B2 precursor, putative [Ricinus communis]|eukprot:XP_002528164.1 patatin-like protein 7 [Ricinus communis]